jgi:hypothetical protein
VLEITKLADQEGPNTIATRSLGDQNLLLVDEGHRGMSGKEEGVWFERRKRSVRERLHLRVLRHL